MKIRARTGLPVRESYTVRAEGRFLMVVAGGKYYPPMERIGTNIGTNLSILGLTKGLPHVRSR